MPQRIIVISRSPPECGSPAPDSLEKTGHRRQVTDALVDNPEERGDGGLVGVIE
jgi:hypothetical protein